jgi:colanic acid/amylovoran biosynthesis glycosyltransferase
VKITKGEILDNLIIFKTNSFPTISETFIVSNIVEAVKNGYQVKIIVDTVNPKTNTSQPDLLAQYGLLGKVSKLEQPKKKIKRIIKVFQYLLNPFLFYYFLRYYLLKKKFSLSYIFILKFYKDFRETKTFHVHFATAIHPLFELKEIGFLKSKIVVTFHGYDEHSLPKGELLNDLIHNFDKYVAHITANTQYLKNKLVAKGFPENKIKIIPIGIDTDFFENKRTEIAEKYSFKIITVGRFVAIKGQSFGIKAVKLLRDKGYKIGYTLVGYGEELNNLKELVSKLNLEDTVIFCGSKDQEELKALLKKSQLFLMTSTSDTTGRCEAFGLVSLEAQGMGVPVIGFKSGGFPETIIEGETGITVEDKNYTEMANTIELLINDHEKRNRMSVAAKKHIKDNFDSGKVTSKYIELYD